ncbi:MAG TPA: 23S rRNA methyltransferase [Gammaproteobacteria bacterium]|nr:23S rRNA methyltransferase [Gammaproteobacteria bacterium]
MARSKSTSRRWMDRHLNDPWVQKAQLDGYRSRASYKLLEIIEKDRLLPRNATVIDLGAAPGGWSQVVMRKLAGRGRVIALDLLPMEPLGDVEFIQGDFRQQQVLDDLLTRLQGQHADLVMSDMAPNLSGIKAVDQPAMVLLLELALELAQLTLKPGGNMLVKVFEGAGMAEYRRQLALCFGRVVMRKPAASRDSSAEQYLLAMDFNGSI